MISIYTPIDGTSAYLVFPEVRTSRFTHSLGCMHLVSQLFAAAIRNTPSDSDLERNINHDLSEVLKDLAKKERAEPAQLDAFANALKDDALLAQSGAPTDLRTNIIITEQSLRLAALFHDLGHLPFSHDFEYGLLEYWKRSGFPQGKEGHSLLSNPSKIHEELGHSLAELLLQKIERELPLNTSPDFLSGARISFNFACEILSDEPDLRDKKSIKQWLHTLVDGDVDADRCDFVLRDGRAFGFRFADYDLDRLVNGFAVFQDPIRGYEAIILAAGRSALESFLLARYRTYQLGVRHHKVSQFAAALRRSISALLSAKNEDEPGREINDFLEDIERVLKAPKDLHTLMSARIRNTQLVENYVSSQYFGVT